MTAVEQKIKQGMLEVAKALKAQGDLTLEELHEELGFSPLRFLPGKATAPQIVRHRPHKRL